MRFVALACDYDGTIAHGGNVAGATLRALHDVRESGRKLILVTGRQLDDLLEAFPGASVFDRIVAENGGVLFRPETRERILLTRPVDLGLVDALGSQGVEPLSVGEALRATREPQRQRVLDAIQERGLELQLICNKGAVMVLPSGVDKASGLTTALLELDLSPRNVAGIGDAENDQAFLQICACGAVLANAPPALRDHADYVTRAQDGAGVREFIGRLLGDDLAGVAPDGTPPAMHR